MAKPVSRILHYFSEDRPSPEVKIDASLAEENLTKQSFKDECDINIILARAERSGMLPARDAMPQFGDFSEVPDYLSALDIIDQAESQFMSLPAAVRKECDNDPAVFLEKVRDVKWAQAHDLAPKPVEPPSASSPGVSPPGAAAAQGAAAAAGGSNPSGKT